MILSKLKAESNFLIKNGWSVFLKLFSVGLSFLAFRWINANLDPQVLEDVNVSLGINGAVIGYIAFGIPLLTQKIYTKYHDNQEYLATAWTTLTFLRGVSFFVGVGVLWIVNLAGLVNFGVMLAIFCSQFLFLADTSYRAIVDADNRSWQFSLSDLISKTVFVLFLFVAAQRISFISEISDLNLYITALIISALTAIGIDTFMQRRYIKFTKVSFDFLREHKSSLIYLSLLSIIIGSFLTTDRVFLKVFGYDEFAINGYANAYKLYETAAIVPGITMPVLASFVYRKLSGIKDQVSKNQVILRYAWLALGAGLIVSLTMVLLGPFAISLIDPKNLYRSISVQSLYILSAGVAINFPLIFFSFQNILGSHEKRELKIQLINLVVALTTYSILISQFSFYGAAISTVIIHSIDLFIRYTLIQRHKKINSTTQPES